MFLNLQYGFSSWQLFIIFIQINSILVISAIQAPLNLSLNASWSQNATTVAGSTLGAAGLSQLLLNYTRGVRLADNDTLYVADSYNNRIVLIQPNSTMAINTIGTGPGSQSSQLWYPADVFVTETSIYILDTQNYRVQMWSKNNSSSPITVAGITGVDGTLSNSTAILSLAYHILVDSNNNLYVSDTDNNRVLRFPPNSSSGTSGVIIAGNGIAGSTNATLNGPFGIFIDSAQSLYIADRLNNRIQKWTFGATSGVTVAGTGVAGSTLSQLNSPRTVVVDVNGYMYISDGVNERILRWAPNSSTGQCIAACTGTTGIASNQLMNAYDMVFDSHGSFYVSDRENNRVQKFSIIANFAQSVNLTTGVTTTTGPMAITTTTGPIVITTTTGPMITAITTLSSTTVLMTSQTSTLKASATSLLFSAVHRYSIIGTLILLILVNLAKGD